MVDFRNGNDINKAVFSSEYIAAVFREVRKDLKLSQAELSELLGITQSMVSKYEKGQANIPTNILGEFDKISGGLYSDTLLKAMERKKRYQSEVFQFEKLNPNFLGIIAGFNITFGMDVNTKMFFHDDESGIKYRIDFDKLEALEKQSLENIESDFREMLKTLDIIQKGFDNGKEDK